MTEMTTLADTENNLQPFFILHRHTYKGRVKPSKAQDVQFNAVNSVWSHIDLTIRDVLRNINSRIFNDVNAWVRESFRAIKSLGDPGFIEATHSHPLVTDTLSSQLFAAFVYTKNSEFVDDQLAFEDLGIHLKSHGCLVANLSSLDFSAKNGIRGCLTRLLRQFLMVQIDAADMSILASWYCGQRECKPVVVIIEDTERCSGSVLSDFILMLSDWLVKIPVNLVMGVATTLDAPGNILSSNALQRLCASKFVLKTPLQKMDAIIESVLLSPHLWFGIGHKVALFVRDYFVKHDGSLTSFTRALKVACMQHFLGEPLSFLLKDADAPKDFEKIWSENGSFMQDLVVKCCSQLSSCSRIGELSRENKVHASADLKKLRRCWMTVVMCLYEAGKTQKVPLLDLYCEALDPVLHGSKASYSERVSSSSNGCFSGQTTGLKRVSIDEAVRNVRDLPPVVLTELIKRWETLADGVCEVHEKVKELQSMMKFADGKNTEYDLSDLSLRRSSRGTSDSKDPKLLNDKAMTLIEWMLRDHMQPIEDIPFHEIFCFKDVSRLQKALLGDPRKTIQTDLLEFHKHMRCSCCSNRQGRLLPSLHDTTIMYILAQEHGVVINVHEWYHSYKATITRPMTKARNKYSPSPKRRKDLDHSPNYSEAVIQARFCRAVSELQITGLLRMPSKRRPDYVQRVAFGL